MTTARLSDGLMSRNVLLLIALWQKIVANNLRAFTLYAVSFLVDGLLLVAVATAVAPLADYFLDPSFAHASAITTKYVALLAWMGLSPSLEALLCIFVLANLVKAASSTILVHYTRKFAYLTVHDLSTACLRSFLSSGLLFFVSHSVGTLNNTMQRESEKLGDAISAMFAMVAVFIQVIALSWIAWALSHTMIAICLSLVPVFLVLTRWLDRYVRRYGALTTARANVTMQVVLEALVGAKLILANARSNAMVDRFSSAYKNGAETAVKGQVIAAAIPILYQAFGFFSVSIALYVGVRRGENVGTLVAALWALLRIAPLISQIVGSLATTSNAMPSFLQYNGLIETAARMAICERAAAFPGFRKAIEYREVSFSYPGRDAALADIDTCIPKGSFVAFVGESGSGKTTAVDLLLRLFEPNAGAITIDSAPLATYTLASFLERVGYVAQESFLFHATLRENLLWAVPNATENELWESLRLANIDDFVRALPNRLDEVVGDRGASLSGGQRQRIALARALLKKPEILILDEATSALDSESEKLIMASIDAVAPHTTIIVIAHRLSTVAHAEKVLVFAGGRIVESGPYATLAKNPASRLFSATLQPG